MMDHTTELQIANCADRLANKTATSKQWRSVLNSLYGHAKDDEGRQLVVSFMSDITAANEDEQSDASPQDQSQRAKHRQPATYSEQPAASATLVQHAQPQDQQLHRGVDQETKERKRCASCAYCIISTCRILIIPLLVVFLALSVATNKDLRSGLHLENFLQQNPDSADQWASLNMQSVRILVTGKTGTGKSALINGLIGKNVTAEGDELDPKTSEVAQFKQMVHGISLSIFDSPGLQDGTRREKEYLRDMERKCAKVDLVLYTIKMTDQRVYAADTDAMQKITDAFGQQFWERAIFVMTFANEVRSPHYPNDELENEKYFESRLQLWREKLPEYFEQRCGIPANIGRHIPIVPAGYYKIRDLPGRKYWFSQFWTAAIKRLMESNVDGASYMLKFSQDRFKKVENTTEQDFEKPIHEQPILSPNIN